MSKNHKIPNIFVGWDSRQPVAHDVCVFSMQTRTSMPMQILPLKQADLREKGFYWREQDEKGSTEFTLTRFLIPFLSDFKGFSVYCDDDFLWLDDIEKLCQLRNPRFAIQVVKHCYHPVSKIKRGGYTQYPYPRKNWSSLIIWNNEHFKNRILTPEFINSATPMFLHRFEWLADTDVGEVDSKWNVLVEPQTLVKEEISGALHFTEGGPWIETCSKMPYREHWINEHSRYLSTSLTSPP